MSEGRKKRFLIYGLTWLMGLGILGLGILGWGYWAGKRAADHWWLKRVTGKEFSVPGSALGEDVYCVYVKDFGKIGFVAQPTSCSAHPGYQTNDFTKGTVPAQDKTFQYPVVTYG